ncbi:RbsD/FucU family protein [Sporosarcina sp. YIM B06819]|uniref:RbsD/FucU family protein n=1 Tax=Sporosarcina sp. YIM B06819 TaxID=3081769 RepID=UPI00298CEBD0|nr:RbsD/FucU family protein [Sporosarcina sp. YIM B06819]
MLKGIPAILSPDLVKTLMEMGHGDEIVLADGNFPSASHAKRLIRCDGHGIAELLTAILALFPLDTYVDYPAACMAVVAGDPVEPVIWGEYEDIIHQQCQQTFPLAYIERFDFYERAKNAYAIVATSEQALYGNIILKKGVI